MTTADTHHPPYWRQHLLAVLGAPLHAESLRFLEAWANAEGGTARWNPLNSTLELPGATVYNTFVVNGQTFHVWNYARPVWGVCATAMTLTNPANGALIYGKIVAALQAGSQTAEQIVTSCRDQISLWGTDPDLILHILAQ